MTAVKLQQVSLFTEEFKNEFISDVKEIFEQMTSTKIESTEWINQNHFVLAGEVAGIVGLAANNNKGALIISFKGNTILEVYNNMLAESETQISAGVKDCVGELSNMVYGKLKTNLNKRGQNFQMSLPTVTNGTFEITKKNNGEAFVLAFETSHKNIFHIAVAVD